MCKMRLKYWMFLFSLFLFTGCSVGYMKDADVGLKVNYDGFMMEDVFMKIDEQKIFSNKIPYGRRVYIVFDEFEGYKIKGGLSSIGCSVSVVNMQGDTVMASPDVFAFTNEGYDADLMKEITISLPALNPLKVGEKYKWGGNFWDKYGNATMKSQVEVEIVSSQDILKTQDLTVDSKGIEYYAAFAEQNYILMKENMVSLDEKLTLNIIDVKGFVKKDSLFAIKYFNSFKNLESGESFEFHDTLYSEKVFHLYSNYTMGSAVEVGKKYLWTSKFDDLNSDAYLYATLPVEIAEE